MSYEHCLQIKNLSLDLKTAFFDKVTILSNVNLTLPGSGVYGLIGPSGCGKTTLFRCLFGFYKPQQGSIKIFGKSIDDPSLRIPGPNFGYVAQDNVLTYDLTVKEMLIFSGRLSFMSDDALKTRIKDVSSQLEITDHDTLIDQLSGGQKRRISLACALLHQPLFLILDEPTVGSDPLLRDKIFKILKDISMNQGTSVIISTHYFEEVNQTDYIAIMNKGSVIKEGTPQNIKESSNANSIEMALLHIFSNSSDLTKSCDCKRDSYQRSRGHVIFDKVKIQSQQIENKSSMLKALLYRIFHRRRSTLLLPLISTIIFTLNPLILQTNCFGKDPINQSIGVFLEIGAGNLTFDLINEINSQGIQIKLATEFDSAHEAVTLGETAGFFVLKSGFTESVINSLEKQKFTDSEKSLVYYHGDETNFIISYYIKKKVERSYQQLIIEQARKLNVSSAVNSFVQVHPLFGDYNNNKVWVGDSSLAFSMFAVNYLTASLGITFHWIPNERSEFFFERLKSSGCDWFTISMSYIISTAIVSIPSSQITLIVARMVLNFGQITDDWFIWHFIAAILSYSGAMMGLIIGTITMKSKFVSAILWTAYTISSMSASAIFTSVYSLPYYADWFRYLFPVSSSSTVLIDHLIKGFSLLSPTIYLNLVFTVGHLLGNIIIFMVLIKLTYSEN